jgi:hypothetical protein
MAIAPLRGQQATKPEQRCSKTAQQTLRSLKHRCATEAEQCSAGVGVIQAACNKQSSILQEATAHWNGSADHTGASEALDGIASNQQANSPAGLNHSSQFLGKNAPAMLAKRSAKASTALFGDPLKLDTSSPSSHGHSPVRKQQKQQPRQQPPSSQEEAKQDSEGHLVHAPSCSEVQPSELEILEATKPEQVTVDEAALEEQARLDEAELLSIIAAIRAADADATPYAEPAQEAELADPDIAGAEDGIPAWGADTNANRASAGLHALTTLMHYWSSTPPSQMHRPAAEEAFQVHTKAGMSFLDYLAH